MRGENLTDTNIGTDTGTNTGTNTVTYTSTAANNRALSIKWSNTKTKVITTAHLKNGKYLEVIPQKKKVIKLFLTILKCSLPMSILEKNTLNR